MKYLVNMKVLCTYIKTVKCSKNSSSNCDQLIYTVNNYRQVTGVATGENFAFFIYRHFVEIL